MDMDQDSEVTTNSQGDVPLTKQVMFYVLFNIFVDHEVSLFMFPVLINLLIKLWKMTWKIKVESTTLVSTNGSMCEVKSNIRG